MKKSILFTVSMLVLAGCGGRPDSKWSDDCVKHHSETGREFAQCQRKLAEKRAARGYAQEQGTVSEAQEIAPGVVSIDPDGAEMQSFKETGKRTRGGAEVSDAAK